MIARAHPKPRDPTFVMMSGCGVQSSAMLALVQQHAIPRPAFIAHATMIFDDEPTAHWREHKLKPFAEALGIPWHDVPTVIHRRELYSRTGRLLIPAYTDTGRLRRFCSGTWKRDPLLAFLRGMGFGPRAHVHAMLGISADEAHRAKPPRRIWYQEVYPLLDLELTRDACLALCLDAFQATPPRTSCTICPMRKDRQWEDLYHNDPAGYFQACEIDRSLRAPGVAVPTYLHRSRMPLESDPWKPRAR